MHDPRDEAELKIAGEVIEFLSTEACRPFEKALVEALVEVARLDAEPHVSPLERIHRGIDLWSQRPMLAMAAWIHWPHLNAEGSMMSWLDRACGCEVAAQHSMMLGMTTLAGVMHGKTAEEMHVYADLVGPKLGLDRPF